jgi:hypothetical protein
MTSQLDANGMFSDVSSKDTNGQKGGRDWGNDMEDV